MTVRILHTADLQIGRIPSRLPEEVDASPAKVWDRIVAYAIEQRLDAVTLGGDIVDAENRYYEAYGPLEQGIRRLSQAGIPVIAVAGNHDVEVFPALADAMEQESFILLGRGGRWERHTITKEGAPALHIDGWSFPAEKHHKDPVEDHDLDTPQDAPVIGLVHGDLDQPQSVYAPLSRARLRQHKMAAWLLGHIHKPQASQDPPGPLILYPGSPQGLDPGEGGLHGAWTLTFDTTGLKETRFLPLARAVYEHHTVDLDGAQDEQEVRRRIVRGTQEHLDRLAQKETGPLEHVVYRLHLTGRTPLHGALRRIVQRIEETDHHEGLNLQSSGIKAHIDKTYIETKPHLDLDEIARGTGPPADLARVLVALQNDNGQDDSPGTGQDNGQGTGKDNRRITEPEPLAQRLITEASATVEDLLDTVHYQPLRIDEEATRPTDARRLLQEQGLLLLEALVAQRQRPEGGDT